MATWIILGIILIASFFAASYSIRKDKSGECIGCSGCKNGCHCQHKESAK